MKRLAAVFSAAVLAMAGAVFAADAPNTLGAPLAANANFSDGILTHIPGLTSMRNAPETNQLITPLDTYDAALLGQTTALAAHITNTAGRVTSHTYDLLSSQHGTMVGSNAIVNITESQTVPGVGQLRVVITVLTADGSPLWIDGITAGTPPLPIIQGRFDVGAGAFTNGLLWDNIPGPITSVAITNALFADGALLATSSPLTNGRTLPEMGTLVVWNGVVGTQVDESQMIFLITHEIPEPTSVAALGLIAVGALARRRRA